MTGTIMIVDESRKEEYLELGHKLAPAPKKTTRKKPVKKEEE